nr:NADH:flavin oxidoreductase/NADH oxidase [uncultured Flavobacterium sp.]
MSKLFESLQLKNHTLQNRIVVSPMCQYTSEDGFANNWHLVHLGQFAIGKAAVIIQEATAICPEGRISYGDLGIWKDEHIEKLAEINEFIKSQGTLAGIQLAHAGRKASTNKPWINRNQFKPNETNGWQTMAPSAIAFNETDHTPKELSLEEIGILIKQFKEATKRSVQAGYDIIEIHGAHGYLIHQFLSPLSNLRKDKYGGSFENRIRFLLEIVDAMKTELTTQSLWIRLSATDWAEGGWTCYETVKLCQILKEKGVEVMDISTGGLVRHQVIPVSKNYQVPFAERVKKETGAVTGAVGLIDSGKQAEEILQNNEADLIFVAREFLRNPHFVYQAAIDLGVDLTWAPQYERGKE